MIVPEMDTSVEDAARARQQRLAALEAKQKEERRQAEQERYEREREQRAERERLDNLPRWNAVVYTTNHTFKFSNVVEEQKNALQNLMRGHDYFYEDDFIKCGSVERVSITKGATLGEQRRYRTRGY